MLYCRSTRSTWLTWLTWLTFKPGQPGFKPGSHLCDKHNYKHKHKLATFPHVKQAQENKAYANAVNVGGDLEIFKMADESSCLCLTHAGSHL